MRVIDLAMAKRNMMMRSMIEEAVEDAPVVLTARTWVMMAGYMTIMARIVTG